MPDDDEYLINAFIEDNPYSTGPSEVRLAIYGVPVWAIIGHWKATGGDDQQVAEDYGVPIEAVHAALAYYRRHQPAIEVRLESNVG